MNQFFLAYVPVVNCRYLELARRFQGSMGVLGQSILSGFPHLTRDVRALKPDQAAELLGCLVLEENKLPALIADLALGRELVMPREDVSLAVRDLYLAEVPVRFESIWLRWDRQNAVSQQVVPSGLTITRDDFWRRLALDAYLNAEQSSDLWRQVGAALIVGGQTCLLARNHHLPTDWSPEIDGDPRFNFNWGEHVECSTAIHAEASVLARAARQGIATESAALLSTTFPCPTCARLIAEAGIKEVYYCEGYSLADAWEIFQAFKISVVLVER